jgi:integrase
MVDKIQGDALLGIDRATSRLFADVWPKFLKDKEIGVYSKPASERTMREYVEFGQRFFVPLIGDKGIDRFTVDDFTDYIETVKEKFPNVHRFENHYKYLSSFFSWADRKRLIPRKLRLFNPDQAIKSTEDSDGVGKVYADEELHAILAAAGEDAFGLWVRMGMFMGMRNSEITQMKKDRIDIKDSVIRLRKTDTKTRRARIIPIPKEVFLLLVAQMAATQSSEWLFPNLADAERPMFRGGFDHRWRRLLDGLGIKGRFHDLRHTYATKIFARRDMVPVVICQVLGMTMRTAEKYYLHFDESQLKTITEGFSVA